MTRWRLALWAIAAVCAIASVAVIVAAKGTGPQCGAGFYPVGLRCCAAVSGDGKECGPARACPKPLELQGADCVAPRVVVDVPETTLVLGAADWEAEGLVAPRTLHVAPFALDAFEITEGDLHPDRAVDRARAAGKLTREEVLAYCTRLGGRLPTEDEWIAAASTAKAHRYPWGDTGAVCRRAAWGLVAGPCGHGAKGPDTVGSHADGDGPLGLHDLAGNVAEWTSTDAGGKAVAVGGSYESQLAAELRTWAHAELDPATRDPALGGRCAYDRPADAHPLGRAAASGSRGLE
ncbi:MAG TPA: SUMF1/EgtB/PvdO family nonheme iron enzyme [Polyangiaceae bacterium]|nr:SUMF1/EgtB/PvdO family nonheme iron enzyme [Polyangiaceae bacterium]